MASGACGVRADSLRWLFLLQGTDSRVSKLSSYGSNSVVVAPKHVESSWTRD